MGKRTWDGACIRLGLVITAVVAVGAVFGPALAAEPIDPPKAQPEPPSIYMTPVPADLAKKIADATEEVKKLHPLTEEDARELKAQVEKVKFGGRN